MNVDMARLALPCDGRYEKRNENSSKPLEEQQPRKQPIRGSMDFLLMMPEQLIGTLDGKISAPGAETYFKHSASGFVSMRPASEQPKTSV